MRVIITGGTGLIGRPLAERLCKDSHEVIVLSRDPARVAGLPTQVRVVAWDGRTADGWGHLADGAGAIFNLAGTGIGDARWTEERKRDIRASRTAAGAAVVAAVRQAASKPGVLIQVSAMGAYADSGDTPVDEAGALGDDFLGSVCRDWEAATAEVEALGVRRCVARVGVVLSAGGGALPRMALPFKLFVGGKVGSGRLWFSWVHMADVVEALRWLMVEPTAAGVYNLTAPQPVTNADFARELGRALGRPSFVPVPAFALKLMYGEMSAVILDGHRVVPRRLEQAGYIFHFAHAVTALSDIYG
jgi:uncharacterized protein (TIGR01777 family)